MPRTFSQPEPARAMHAHLSLRRLVRILVQKWRRRYEPSKHYMRGPGPAAQTQAAPTRSDPPAGRPQVDRDKTLT